MPYLGGHGEMLQVRRRSSRGWLARRWHHHRATTLIASVAALAGVYLGWPLVADGVDKPDDPAVDPDGVVQPGARLVRQTPTPRSQPPTGNVVTITHLRDGRVLVSVSGNSGIRVVRRTGG